MQDESPTQSTGTDHERDQVSGPEEAARFLHKLRPGGPWHACRKNLETGAFVTEVFTGQDALKRWVKRHDGLENLYYGINLWPKEKAKKATKEDVVRVEYLQADLDPREGELTSNAKARYLANLTVFVQQFNLKPSCIVDSGNGFQCLWRLKEPVGPESFAQVEAINKALVTCLDSPDVSGTDVSRAFRVPGTWNLPDQGKVKKGRVKCSAKVLRLEEDAYSLGDFFPVLSAKKGSKTGQKKAKKSEAEDAELIENIKDGRNLHDSILRLSAKFIARGISEDGVIGLIEGLMELTPEPARDDRWRERYKDIKRQVQGATKKFTPEGQEEILEEMNDEFFVISISGQSRVGTFRMEETEEGESRLVLELHSFQSFRDLVVFPRIPQRNASGGIFWEDRGNWWLDQEGRRQYSGLAFKPGLPKEITVKGKHNKKPLLNLWQGWGVEPKPGNWDLIKTHVREVLANGNEDSFNYIIKTTAWWFQNPGKRGEVALIFKGGKGSGKGVAGRLLKRIFGQHGLHISSSGHLTGKFNAHFNDCALLFADEAYWPGDKSVEGTLKRMITEPTLLIEPKGINAYEVTNALKIIMAANADWVVPASVDERRFAVFAVSEAHKQSKAHFEPLYANVAAEGPAAMLYDLLAMDLKGWHPREGVPPTNALQDQKELSLEALDVWWLTLLRQGWLPGTALLADHGNRSKNPPPRPPRLDEAPSQALYHHARTSVPKLKSFADAALSRGLEKYGVTKGSRINGNGARTRRFPPLKEARETWAKDMPETWDDPEEEWIPDPLIREPDGSPKKSF
jgi:hypothetical protein